MSSSQGQIYRDGNYARRNSNFPDRPPGIIPRPLRILWPTSEFPRIFTRLLLHWMCPRWFLFLFTSRSVAKFSKQQPETALEQPGTETKNSPNKKRESPRHLNRQYAFFHFLVCFAFRFSAFPSFSSRSTFSVSPMKLILLDLLSPGFD